jgi:hypothetical protein
VSYARVSLQHGKEQPDRINDLESIEPISQDAGKGKRHTGGSLAFFTNYLSLLTKPCIFLGESHKQEGYITRMKNPEINRQSPSTNCSTNGVFPKALQARLR